MKPIQVISVCSALFLLLPFNVGYISGFLYGVDIESPDEVIKEVSMEHPDRNIFDALITLKNTGRIRERYYSEVIVIDSSNLSSSLTSCT